MNINVKKALDLPLGSIVIVNNFIARVIAIEGKEGEIPKKYLSYLYHYNEERREWCNYEGFDYIDVLLKYKDRIKGIFAPLYGHNIKHLLSSTISCTIDNIQQNNGFKEITQEILQDDIIELTIKEIAEKFNIDPKILRIKDK